MPKKKKEIQQKDGTFPEYIFAVSDEDGTHAAVDVSELVQAGEKKRGMRYQKISPVIIDATTKTERIWEAK